MDQSQLPALILTLAIALAAAPGCGSEPVQNSTPADAGTDSAPQVDANPVPECARFITAVTAHSFGPGQNVGQDRFPEPLFGPPKGGGGEQGSLDVVSLGNGGSVTLEFGETAIIDGPGADFIVFENPFWVGGDESLPFAELGTVEVSEDGQTWHAFECTALSAPYGSCAGWHPVFANADENTIDPLDPDAAGGDAFDLAELGISEARWVRITDRVDQIGTAGVFDLDAVGIVNALCP